MKKTRLFAIMSVILVLVTVLLCVPVSAMVTGQYNITQSMRGDLDKVGITKINGGTGYQTIDGVNYYFNDVTFPEIDGFDTIYFLWIPNLYRNGITYSVVSADDPAIVYGSSDQYGFVVSNYGDMTDLKYVFTDRLPFSITVPSGTPNIYCDVYLGCLNLYESVSASSFLDVLGGDYYEAQIMSAYINGLAEGARTSSRRYQLFNPDYGFFLYQQAETDLIYQITPNYDYTKYNGYMSNVFWQNYNVDANLFAFQVSSTESTLTLFQGDLIGFELYSYSDSAPFVPKIGIAYTENGEELYDEYTLTYNIDLQLWTFVAEKDYLLKFGDQIIWNSYGVAKFSLYYAPYYAVGIVGSTFTYENGYDAGYKEGLKEGEKNGYNKGYADGIATVDTEGLSALVFAFFDAPFATIQNYLDFEILGFNFANFFFSILTMCLVAVVIKKLV